MNDADSTRLQLAVGILVVGFGVTAVRSGLAGVSDLFSAMTVEIIFLAGMFAFWLLVGGR